MFSRSVILAIAAMAASSSAQLMPRQTNINIDVGGGSIDLGCVTSVTGLLDSAPTPPPALVSEWSQNPPDDACSYTGSQSSEYSSYSSEIESWLSSNEGEVRSFVSSCPEVTNFIGLVGGEYPICTSDLESVLEAASPTTSSPPDNAAPRETGAAMAALAVVGLVAAIL
ncbi:hypothetical protein B0I35DRAFT_424935 [Stachybotrys elegans]|uniref:Infection structure specific protein n=1 Tax=Stachybotrys elegans TaxID=80388 RepID=A0A8K0T272_9HYPO|nr:hypothetical protein B0I35DRAFT_424935 [Stachybotrys elegans]